MTDTVDTRGLLRDSLRQLRQTRAALDAMEARHRQPIAVLGAGVRLPGGVSDLPSLWAALDDGRDAVVPMTTPPDGRRAPIEARPVSGEWGGQLEAVDGFDSDFFGISALEADQMDPQQRLVLEVAWEAVEDAGLTLTDLHDAVTGVFLGIYGSDYLALQLEDPNDRATAYSAPGAAHSIAANRLSYLLDLHGPSIAVDTACSSSLVAIHLACRALRAGDCDLALVGGVNLILSPVSSLLTGKVLPLSPTGRCRTFDAGADGIVRGEGCGMLVLARDTDAFAARRRLRARIRGSAVNHDGRTNGLTAPNPRAQAQLIERALADGGCAASDVAFVEAHGTGTTLGDPIEIEALVEVYGRGERPCALGALKSNIGHLEAAAGIAGLIKAMLVLERREIPRNLHLERLNPEIDLGRRLRIPDGPMALSEGDLAAVSSFGFGGANAHVILGEGDRAEAAEVGDGRADRLMLPISARSSAALAALSRRYAERLADCQEREAARICAAAAHRRTHHAYRACVVGDSAAELRQELDRTATFRTGASSRRPRIAFLFSGQGTQWPAMGAELLTSEPTFSAEVEACEAVVRDLTGWSVIEELRAPPAESRVHITEVAQLAIATLQLGLAALWRSWGVEPDAVAGHSMGEIVATCAAGVISRRDALGLLAQRARITERAARGGRMASIGLDREVVDSLLEVQGGRVSIAAVNGPRSTVVSGEAGAVESVVAAALKLRARTRVLPVEYGFHSPLLDGCAEQLEPAAAAITATAASIPMYSSVTGDRIAGERLDSAHWGRNLREAVLFAPAIRALSRDGVNVFLEIGPHPALGADVEATLETLTGDHTVLGSLRRRAPSRLTLGWALAGAYCSGVPVRWDAVMAAPVGEVALPSYPWQRRRHWLPDPAPTRARPQADPQTATPTELAAPPVPVAVEPEAPDVDALTLGVRERIAAAMDGADVDEVPADGPLEALGLDSIVLVELKNQLERDLGIRIPLQVLLEAATPRHLAEGVVAALRAHEVMT